MSEKSYEEVLAKQNTLIFSPGGTSMQPLLHGNKNPVVLVPYKHDGLKKLDVVLFKRIDGQYVLHRVVGVGKNGYTFCGDNQTWFERGVTDNMIIARMVGYYKGSEYVDCVNNAEYRAYSRKRVASIPFRRVYNKCVFVAKKILRRKK